jgi:undecaprenyl-diphosphatase
VGAVLGLVRRVVSFARRLAPLLRSALRFAGSPGPPAPVPAARAQWRTGLSSLAIGSGAAVFGLLGWLVGSGSAASVDLAISTGVQSADSSVLDLAMQAVSSFGSSSLGLLGLVGAPLVLWRVGHPLASRFVALSALGAIGGATLLKQLWQRQRPTHDLIQVVGGSPEGHSFPSGHTLLYVSFFGFLLYWTYTFVPPGRVRTLLLWTFAGLIGLIGLARVYLGHHWASDVLASYALGFAWLLILVQLYTRARRSRGQRHLLRVSGS